MDCSCGVAIIRWKELPGGDLMVRCWNGHVFRVKEQELRKARTNAFARSKAKKTKRQESNKRNIFFANLDDQATI